MTSKARNEELDVELTERWESGELGRSEEHAIVAPAELCAALDSNLGLQLVSIRLQRQLIDSLKLIAKYRGVAYQPLIRDLLNRFATSELKDIAYELQKKQERAAVDDEGVVSQFMQREMAERKRA